MIVFRARLFHCICFHLSISIQQYIYVVAPLLPRCCRRHLSCRSRSESAFYHLIDSVAQAKLSNAIQRFFSLNKMKKIKKQNLKKSKKKQKQKHFSFALTLGYIVSQCSWVKYQNIQYIYICIVNTRRASYLLRTHSIYKCKKIYNRPSLTKSKQQQQKQRE